MNNHDERYQIVQENTSKDPKKKNKSRIYDTVYFKHWHL